MDFSPEAFKKNNGQYGQYDIFTNRKIDLPNLFLLYNKKPSESGKIHSDVKSRYNHPNPDISGPVKQAMQEFARLTDEFKEAMLAGDIEKCMALQNENFDRRRELYGDKVIGEDNLEMVTIPRDIGCSSKFSGSGGAIVGIYESETQ